MPRLVVLSEGYTGRSHKLEAELTTVGRVEDNHFQIPDPSVSSHHAEVIMKSPNEVLIRDLGSTNGTFIGKQQITEATIKPSQVVRFGQIEVRLEGDSVPAPTKKVVDQTQIIPQGVKLDESNRTATAGTNPGFKGKSNQATKVFIILAVILAVGIVGALVWLLFIR